MEKKFIVDWENGTQVAYNGVKQREMCISFAQLYLGNLLSEN